MSEIYIMLCCVSACVYVALCACIGICFVVVSVCVCVGSGVGEHIAAQGHAATACMCKPSAHQPVVLYSDRPAFVVPACISQHKRYGDSSWHLADGTIAGMALLLI